jgi:hypothetical protein
MQTRRSRRLLLIPLAIVVVVVGAGIAVGLSKPKARVYQDVFVPAGPMATPQIAYQTVLLQDGRVLVAHGRIPGGGLLPLELFSPATSTFAPSGSFDRTQFTAVLLRDGRVLLLGGTDHAGATVADTSVFDPRTGAISITGPMRTPRFSPGAVVMPDGRVLVLGGAASEGDYPTTAEVFDPTTGTFSAAGAMARRRTQGRMLQLADGRVLLFRGTEPSGDWSDAIEIYDPRTNAFTMTGPMTTPRAASWAVLLRDGRVLFVSGLATAGPARWTPQAEILNPTTGLFAPTGSMKSPDVTAPPVVLADGRVLLAGLQGEDGEAAPAEVFDPASGIFTPTGPMVAQRYGPTLVPLQDGRVLVFGGTDFSASPERLVTAEVFDPRTSTFASAGGMTRPRGSSPAVLLNDGRVLVLAGQDASGSLIPTAELFQ